MARKLESEIADTMKKDKKSDLVQKIWIPTGSTLLDLVCGAGKGMGHQAPGIISICGDSQGGKTMLCNELIFNGRLMYKDRFRWVYDDVENGNSFDCKSLYGFDIIPENEDERTSSASIEHLLTNITMFMRSLKGEEFGIYVVDSLDFLMSEATDKMAEERIEAQGKGKEYDKGTYGQDKARFLSTTFYPKIFKEVKLHNCLVVLISQLRDNIGAGQYGPKDKVSGGGRSTIFALDTRFFVSKKADIGPEDRPIGVIVHATTRKGKARGPCGKRECIFPVYFDYGIDDIGGNIDFLYDLRTPERGELKKKAASEIEWDGETYTRAELIKHIEDNKLRKELRRRVVEMWGKMEAEARSEISGRASRWEEE